MAAVAGGKWDWNWACGGCCCSNSFKKGLRECGRGAVVRGVGRDGEGDGRLWGDAARLRKGLLEDKLSDRAGEGRRSSNGSRNQRRMGQGCCARRRMKRRRHRWMSGVEDSTSRTGERTWHGGLDQRHCRPTAKDYDRLLIALRTRRTRDEVLRVRAALGVRRGGQRAAGACCAGDAWAHSKNAK